jgi:hypothetical protein
VEVSVSALNDNPSPPAETVNYISVTIGGISIRIDNSIVGNYYKTSRKKSAMVTTDSDGSISISITSNSSDFQLDSIDGFCGSSSSSSSSSSSNGSSSSISKSSDSSGKISSSSSSSLGNGGGSSGGPSSEKEKWAVYMQFSETATSSKTFKYDQVVPFQHQELIIDQNFDETYSFTKDSHDTLKNHKVHFTLKCFYMALDENDDDEFYPPKYLTKDEYLPPGALFENYHVLDDEGNPKGDTTITSFEVPLNVFLCLSRETKKDIVIYDPNSPQYMMELNESGFIYKDVDNDQFTGIVDPSYSYNPDVDDCPLIGADSCWVPPTMAFSYGEDRKIKVDYSQDLSSTPTGLDVSSGSKIRKSNVKFKNLYNRIKADIVKDYRTATRMVKGVNTKGDTYHHNPSVPLSVNDVPKISTQFKAVQDVYKVKNIDSGSALCYEYDRTEDVTEVQPVEVNVISGGPCYEQAYRHPTVDYSHYSGIDFCPEIMTIQRWKDFTSAIQSYNSNSSNHGFPTLWDGNGYNLSLVGSEGKSLAYVVTENVPDAEADEAYNNIIYKSMFNKHRGIAGIQKRIQNYASSLRNGNTLNFGFDAGKQVDLGGSKVRLKYDRETKFFGGRRLEEIKEYTDEDPFLSESSLSYKKIKTDGIFLPEEAYMDTDVLSYSYSLVENFGIYGATSNLLSTRYFRSLETYEIVHEEKYFRLIEEYLTPYVYDPYRFLKSAKRKQNLITYIGKRKGGYLAEPLLGNRDDYKSMLGLDKSVSFSQERGFETEVYSVSGYDMTAGVNYAGSTIYKNIIYSYIHNYFDFPKIDIEDAYTNYDIQKYPFDQNSKLKEFVTENLPNHSYLDVSVEAANCFVNTYGRYENECDPIDYNLTLNTQYLGTSDDVCTLNYYAPFENLRNAEWDLQYKMRDYYLDLSKIEEETPYSIYCYEHEYNNTIYHKFDIEVDVTLRCGAMMLLPTGRQALFKDGEKIRFLQEEVDKNESNLTDKNKEYIDDKNLFTGRCIRAGYYNFDYRADVVTNYVLATEVPRTFPINKEEELHMVFDYYNKEESDLQNSSPMPFTLVPDNTITIEVPDPTAISESEPESKHTTTVYIDGVPVNRHIYTFDPDTIDMLEKTVTGFEAIKGMVSIKPSEGYDSLERNHGKVKTTITEEFDNKSSMYNNPVDTTKFLNDLCDLLDGNPKVIDLSAHKVPYMETSLLSIGYGQQISRYISVPYGRTIETDKSVNDNTIQNSPYNKISLGVKFPTNKVTEAEKIRMYLEKREDFEIHLTIDKSKLEENKETLSYKIDFDDILDLVKECLEGEEKDLPTTGTLTISGGTNNSGECYGGMFWREVKNIDAHVVWEDPRIYPEDLLPSALPQRIIIDPSSYALSDSQKYGYIPTLVEFKDEENLTPVMTEDGKLVYPNARNGFVLEESVSFIDDDKMYSMAELGVPTGNLKTAYFPGPLELVNNRKTPTRILDSLFILDWIK